MVQANLSEKEEVKRALQNADIVFAVTNFWDPEIIGKDITLEVKQGKILADAAKENQVSWFLWSSLPNVTKQSNGKIQHVDHFSGKNDVEEYIKSIGLPATFIYVACYMSNFGQMFPLVPNADGSQSLKVPEVKEDTYFDLVDTATDTGSLVRSILQNRNSYLGKSVPVVGDRITFKEIADTFSKVTGIPTRAATMTKEELDGPFSFLNNSELLDMLAWFREYGYYGNTFGSNGTGAVEAAKTTGFQGTKFEDFLRHNIKSTRP
ncbi:hypothetical protein BC943DRAFT_317304 [Umbelopsis sp. AD052]|nr:hypothetical protein BC943DRAFT_317304 [Umbelopsis sp. AD052]